MQTEGNSSSLTAEYVLDSYAVLAYLEAEPGSTRVRQLLTASKARKCRLFMCAVNLGEVIYIIERERGLPAAQDTLARIDELPIEIKDVDRTLTLAAAHLKTVCPISYADCFAAALAQVRNAVLVTGDPEFVKIKAEHKIQIEWLAKKSL
jgi:predicted nucleic acid-binding protein